MSEKLKDVKRQNRNISLKILLKMLAVLAAYSAAGLIVYWLAVFVYGQFVWYGKEFLYRIVHWLDLRTGLIALMYFGIGGSIIFLYYWNKSFKYLDDVLEAAESVYNPDDSIIELPDELKKAEVQMNNIKFTMREKERKAREAEQRKNDLVVYLAHDLKTPLTSIIGYLTLLRDEKQISPELREKYIGISLSKAERLEDLINEFFDITRFNLTDLTLELSRVNLTRMLEQIAFEFQPMLNEKGLTVSLDAPKDLMVMCDVWKMQRVFDNLLRNAVNYSFINSEINIIVIADNENIKITFFNRGDTIPKERLKRIFEQFYRLDTSRSTKSGGAGLGLAIAKEIVELHGGTITAFSRDETISFELVIPVL